MGIDSKIFFGHEEENRVTRGDPRGVFYDLFQEDEAKLYTELSNRIARQQLIESKRFSEYAEDERAKIKENPTEGFEALNTVELISKEGLTF